MKQLILLLISVIILLHAISIEAIQLDIDCNGTDSSPNLDASVMCNDNSSSVAISYYLTNITTENNLDQISVTIDYDDALLYYESTGLNTGIGRTELMESGNGSARFYTIEDDNNTVTTTTAILKDCVTNETCPIGDGNVLKITFNCLNTGTIYCSGDNATVTIADSRNLSTTDTWWLYGDSEYGGEKRLFEIFAGPEINSISGTPTPQGFGENVTVTANITDINGTNDIDTVLIGITPPGESETNYSMVNVSNDTWQFS